MHLLRLRDQLFAELRVRDGDKRLGTLPGRHALEADFAILGDNIMDIGTCVGYD